MADLINDEIKPQGRAHDKVEEVRTRLRALAFERGPGRQLPTIRELCVLLNTSRTTLAEALDLLEVERVLSRKERQGIYVSPSLHETSIAIIFNPELFSRLGSSPFWGLLWGQLLEESQRRSIFQHEHCTLHSLASAPDPTGEQPDWFPEQGMEILRTQHCQGCLVVGFNLKRRKDGSIDVKIPHVVFAGSGLSMVQTATYEEGRLGAELLIQQGCKRPGMWLPSHASAEVFGFQETLEQMGHKFQPELMRRVDASSERWHEKLSVQEQGYMLAREVFGRSGVPRPDGVLISDDLLADGALAALDELGVQIGRDIKIVSHAITGSTLLFGRTRHITLLEYSPADYAHAMFSALDKLLAGYKTDELIVTVHPKIRPARL